MRTFLTAALIALFSGFAAPSFAADEKPKDPEMLFKRMDADKDGKLTETEFVGKRTGEMAEKAKKAFAAGDKDKDGTLDLEEFKALSTKKKKKE